MTYEADVVVVGCGIAGMSAAVSAAQQGARVRVLERSPGDERGGNSRYTSGNIRMADTSKAPTEYADPLMAASDVFVRRSLKQLTLQPYEDWPPILRAYGFADPELVMAFIDNAVPSVEWLGEVGVRLESSTNPTTGRSILETIGGGHDAVEHLGNVAEGLGAVFHYETSARGLILDERGGVCGVRAWSKEEGLIELRADAVVLACGGFEGNPEMCTRYLGPESYRLRTVCRGGMYNKGEGIEMAMRIGAATAGQFDGYHSMICDPRSNECEAIQPWNYGILVNNKGQRFVDEGADSRDKIAHRVGESILRQPGGMAFFVYDSAMTSIPNFQRQLGSEQPPITASTIEGLAKAMEIDAVGLRTTIDDFNAAVLPGTFRPVVPDGKGTTSLSPPKSNWAVAIEQAPFMTYPVVCTNVFTFGGLRVSPRAQVMNTDGYEIPGLFAAGETVGFYYGSYLGGTSYLRGLVLGRLAGVGAAAVSAASIPR